VTGAHDPTNDPQERHDEQGSSDGVTPGDQSVPLPLGPARQLTATSSASQVEAIRASVHADGPEVAGKVEPTRVRRRRHPVTTLTSTRHVMLAWCLWLLGSWGTTLWVDRTAPALRWMIFAAAVGLMIMWPMLRLSQPGDPPRPRKKKNENTRTPARHASACRATPTLRRLSSPRLILQDWFSLMVVLQATIWPLSVTGQWSTIQTAWLDGAIAAWSLLAAAITAWGRRSQRAIHRTLAMTIIVLLFVGEPIVQAIVGYGAANGYWQTTTWPMRISPIAILWELVEPADPVPITGEPYSYAIVSMAVAAVAAWVLLFIHSKTDHPNPQGVGT